MCAGIAVADGRAGRWAAALTLAERVRAAREHRPMAAPLNLQRPPHRRRDASFREPERLRDWRRQRPFDGGDWLDRRLRSDGIGRSEFAQVLAEPATRAAERLGCEPGWVTSLEVALSDPASGEPLPAVVPKVPADLHRLFSIAQPLISRARRGLRDDASDLCRRHGGAPFDPSTVDELFLGVVLPELSMITVRPVILELSLASRRGELQGDTSTERYQHFVASLGDPGRRRELLQAYPVLARLLAVRIGYWRRFARELLARLCADWQELRNHFRGGADLGPLCRLSGRLGDSHRGGRSVVALEFATGVTVIYKPRSLAVDVHFSELQAWLHERGWQPALRVPAVLPRSGYGWAEFCAPKPCHSDAQVRRFFQRQGGLLALLYLLQATDVHSENVVACGEHPVIVDLEGLMQPQLPAPSAGTAATRASRLLATSVLRVGYLPFKSWGHADAAGVDISALGAEAGSMSPFDVPRYERLGTDQFRIGRGRVPLRGRPSRPTLRAGQPVDVAEHVESLLDGFTRMYRLLAAHRRELVAAKGPLAAFRRDPIRVVLRETRTYGVLLFESYHPDVLRDALERDLLLDRLWVEVVRRAELEPLIPAERADLASGDVPCFTTRPDSVDLDTGDGALLPGFFATSGFEAVREVVGRLGEADLERQSWLVRASMAGTGGGERHWQPPDLVARARATASTSSPSPEAELEPGRLLAAARAIGDRLHALAIPGDGGAAWLGLAAGGQARSPAVVLGCDLYHGTAGIALFLAELARLTQEDKYDRLVRAALGTLQRQVEQTGPQHGAIGGFSGWGGILYAYTALAAGGAHPELLDEAEILAERRLPALIDDDRQFDVIAGAAGCLVCLLALHRHRPSPAVLALAERCGDHLIRHARHTGEGVGWVNGKLSVRPLTGFSHGTAGIAWALARLARVTGQPRFEATARDALRHERGCFLPDQRNWPDLRRSGTFDGSAGPARCMTAWCHGAPGIGLSRLDLLPHLADPMLEQEIRHAVAATITSGFGTNHSLCHGDLGNLEFLLSAEEAIGAAGTARVGRRVAAELASAVAAGKWRCGTPGAVETPGLMTGLAGIGYGLLRLAHRAAPSVLLLAPPGVRTD